MGQATVDRRRDLGRPDPLELATCCMVTSPLIRS
jgi:hypothetical protein